jgi:hypothetical protein
MSLCVREIAMFGHRIALFYFFEINHHILRPTGRLIKNLPAPFGTLEGKECVRNLLA